VSHRLDSPCMLRATQNPIEQEGTYALPEAQLDRFMLKVLIEYPALEDEAAVLRLATDGRSAERLNVDAVATVLQPDTLVELQAVTAQLAVDAHVHDYALRIVRATRSFPGIAVGASTRAAIALVRAARALALLGGRDFVTPDDIKQLAPAVLRHRIAPAADLAIEGHTADMLIAELLEKIEAPRL
jgi:MoxR-like ATPase